MQKLLKKYDFTPYGIILSKKENRVEATLLVATFGKILSYSNFVASIVEANTLNQLTIELSKLLIKESEKLNEILKSEIPIQEFEVFSENKPVGKITVYRNKVEFKDLKEQEEKILKKAVSKLNEILADKKKREKIKRKGSV